MPRITTEGISNFDESREPGGATYIANHVVEPHWPPKHKVSVSAPVEHVHVSALVEEPASEAVLIAAGEAPPKSAVKADWVEHAVLKGADREEAEAATKQELIDEYGGEDDEPSAGTSSSKSEKKRAKSGGSAQDTESSTPSPVPNAESPSGKDQPTKQVLSSSASSTAGSIRVTGPSQQSQSSSSADPQAAEEATPGQSELGYRSSVPSAGGFLIK